MKEGYSDRLYIKSAEGDKEVWLEPVRMIIVIVPGSIQKTHNPFWMVRSHPSKQGYIQRWLSYLDADGSTRKARVHAHYGSPPRATTNPFTELWFETIGLDHKNRKSRVNSIQVQDWEGGTFEVFSPPIHLSLPQQPTFRIERLSNGSRQERPAASLEDFGIRQVTFEAQGTPQVFTADLCTFFGGCKKCPGVAMAGSVFPGHEAPDTPVLCVHWCH
jgi:hypothetical protein